MIHLDTHIVVWSYAQRRRLPERARRLIERESCQISQMVRFEIETLFERGRIASGADAMLKGVADTIGLTISETPLSDIVGQSLRFAWTRDPFDRLIVANAMADGVRLVTADALILANFQDAVW